MVPKMTGVKEMDRLLGVDRCLLSVILGQLHFYNRPRNKDASLLIGPGLEFNSFCPKPATFISDNKTVFAGFERQIQTV